MLSNLEVQLLLCEVGHRPTVASGIFWTMMTDLSPSLRMGFMAFLNSSSHVAALLGSVSITLSEIGWIAFKVLRRKLRCVNGSSNSFSRIDQAPLTEVTRFGGMRDAAFPVRASWSLSN